MFLSRSGGELLSHVLRRSTIAAAALNFRVRDGIGCFARAMTTRPGKEHHIRRFERLSFVQVLLTDQTALLFLDQIKPIGQLVPVN